jgi:hypothetical protein
MQCEDVQKEIALARSLAEAPELVRAHLDSCLACRKARTLYGQLNQALAKPSWEPPVGFALQVAELAQPVPKPVAEHFSAAGMLRHVAAMFASAVFILSYLAMHSHRPVLAVFASGLQLVAVNALTIAAVSAAPILFATFWLTRRILAE